MNDINDGRWTHFLEILDKLADIATVSTWCIDAFSCKVIQFFEMGVHYDFFFISVFERLGSWKPFVIVFAVHTTCDDVHAFPKSEEIASEDVHINSFSDVVGIVSSQYLVSLNFHRSSIQSLSSENTTKCAIVGKSNNLNYLVHGPAIKVFIAYNC